MGQKNVEKNMNERKMLITGGAGFIGVNTAGNRLATTDQCVRGRIQAYSMGTR